MCTWGVCLIFSNEKSNQELLRTANSITPPQQRLNHYGVTMYRVSQTCGLSRKVSLKKLLSCWGKTHEARIRGRRGGQVTQVQGQIVPLFKFVIICTYFS